MIHIKNWDGNRSDYHRLKKLYHKAFPLLAKNTWKDGTHPTIMIAQHSNNYMKWDYETSWSKATASGTKGQYVMVAR